MVRTNAQHPNIIVVFGALLPGFVMSWDNSGGLSGYEETPGDRGGR
jgi:hypothetical protein